MADVRISSSLPAVTAATPARSSEAVRAAQRAFFDTALSNAASPAAARPPSAPAAATPVASPRPQTTISIAADGQTPPTRSLRPGSLIDIRV